MLKAAVLDGLIAQNVFSRSVTEELAGAVRSTPWVGDAVEAQVVRLANVKAGGPEVKPITSLHFEALSTESSPGSQANTRVKLQIAHPQLEAQERKEQ